MQVPAEVALIVPLELFQEHPVAVPLVTPVITSEPVPEPPDTELTLRGVCEYGNLLLVALSVGFEIGICSIRETVMSIYADAALYLIS